MSIRLSNLIHAGLFVPALVVVLSAAVAIPSTAQQAPAQTAPAPPEPVTAAPSPEADVSEVQQHFRAGVDLYNRNHFLEALNEFNRALALDPTNEDARIFRDKAQAKLQIGAVGGESGGPASFDVLDPESIPAGVETPRLSAEETRIQAVRDLLAQGEVLLENQLYARAVPIFEQVLLIAPDNERARAGLHAATIGASERSLKGAEERVIEDRTKIRKFIEDQKTLPEGAGPNGIKPYRIVVPPVDEEYVAPTVRTAIDEALDAEVTFDFTEVHITEIIEFVSETYGVNIVLDNRVVMPAPVAAPPTAAGAPAAGMPGAPGMPGMMPGAPGAYPGGPGAGGMSMSGPRSPMGGPQARPQFGGNLGNYQNMNQPGMTGTSMLGGEYVTNGMVSYIRLMGVTLREALRVLLRTLNLDYAIQPGLIWISTPDRIRLERSFEELETKFYELRNAGAETLFKIVLRNPGGGGMMGGMMGGGMGGMGGGMGGYGGGMGGMGGYSGGMGGMGGGMGGMGGMGGGYGGGGMGGMGGSYGGGMGGMSGGMGGMGGMGGGYGGGMGGMGGGMGGMGGRMGGMGMGGMGGGGGVQIANISQLFGTISDTMVGEPPATIGIAGLSGGGTGAVGNAGMSGSRYSGGLQGGTNAAQLGSSAGRADNMFGDEPEIVRLLRQLIDDVYEPNGIEPISRMIYVPQNNLLIVHNTPTNLRKLEQQLSELDATPKQVSIEAKFLTVKASDLDKVGFSWDSTQTDQASRNQQIPELEDDTYLYDINGDGVPEEIPFYKRPTGANVITNTITKGVLEALVSPGPAGAFSLSGIITDNEDGDTVSVVFDYLNTLEESELLSAPRVTTMNRKPAVIADLATEYFVSSVNTAVVTSEAGLAGSSSLGYTQQVTPTPFNFGITLSVTPQISGTDQVRLWLNPQVTTRGIEKNFTQKSVIDGTEITSTITLPNTSTQAVWTNVIVHDGDTLVLGGLVSDSTIKGTHKMPYLADIPIVGFFFRGKSRSVTQSSLLIFVTPTIIDTTGARFFEAGYNSGSAYPRSAGTVNAPAPVEEEPLAGATAPLGPETPALPETTEPPAAVAPVTPASPVAPVAPVVPPAAEVTEVPMESL